MYDTEGKEQYVIRGYWDEEFNIAPVKSGEGKNKEIGNFKQLWKADPVKSVVCSHYACVYTCTHTHTHNAIHML